MVGARWCWSGRESRRTSAPYVHVKTLEGAEQVIAQGPVASQEIIKELGTNGGGFFNANSAHPYENPTPLSNLLEMLAIFAIGAGLTHTFGKMAGDRRQGWALFAAMANAVSDGRVHARSGASSEAIRSSPRWESTRRRARLKAAATWKARRCASASSIRRCGRRSPPTLRAARSIRCTTATRRWAASIPLLNMQIGEIIFGGVGSGLFGMLVMAVLSVFIAGLMVGRTPEYLGKKIEGARDEARDALHPDFSRRDSAAGRRSRW